eukprot:13234508-Heterocapsa_arctica.AAC.1
MSHVQVEDLGLVVRARRRACPVAFLTKIPLDRGCAHFHHAELAEQLIVAIFSATLDVDVLVLRIDLVLSLIHISEPTRR